MSTIVPRPRRVSIGHYTSTTQCIFVSTAANTIINETTIAPNGITTGCTRRRTSYSCIQPVNISGCGPISAAITTITHIAVITPTIRATSGIATVFVLQAIYVSDFMSGNAIITGCNPNSIYTITASGNRRARRSLS